MYGGSGQSLVIDVEDALWPKRVAVVDVLMYGCRWPMIVFLFCFLFTFGARDDSGLFVIGPSVEANVYLNIYVNFIGRWRCVPRRSYGTG